jgi:hypothetical protein
VPALPRLAITRNFRKDVADFSDSQNMKKLLYIAVAVGLVVFMAQAKELFPQSKVLNNSTLVRLEDAWLFDQNTPVRLLRTRFTYQGEDPNIKYTISASLHADGKPIKSDFIWQTGIPRTPDQPKDNLSMIWEFRDYPKSAEALTLSLTFTERGKASQKKTIDFILPRPDLLRSQGGEVK